MPNQTYTGRPQVPGTVPQKPQHLADLMQELYPELRQIAAHYFRRESPHRTLHRTALVHEAFIRLARNGPKKYFNRAHFFGVVARAMQQILVEHARGRRAQKRGGDWRRIPFEEMDVVGPEAAEGIALNAVLKRLNSVDPALGRIVELRLLAGLSTSETASVLRRGESTVRRDWAVARAWLQRELSAGHSV